jgi:hypothetical protein
MGCFDTYCRICGLPSYNYPIKQLDRLGYAEGLYDWMVEYTITTPTQTLNKYDDDGYGKVLVNPDYLILLSDKININQYKKLYKMVEYGYMTHTSCMRDIEFTENLFDFLHTYQPSNLIVQQYAGQHFDFESIYKSNKYLLIIS